MVSRLPQPALQLFSNLKFLMPNQETPNSTPQLRDTIASAVLPSLIESVTRVALSQNENTLDLTNPNNHRELAKIAYGFADAMLEERAKTK